MNLKMYNLLLTTTLVLGISTGIAGQSPTGKNDAEQKVLDFVTAFNQQNVDAMLILARTDVTWMSVSGETISKEASGAEDLKASMLDYFSTHPSSFSSIEQIQSSGPWVTTLERAGRLVEGQFKGQCAYAMYQLADGLIRSVWYFSAHPCDKQ